VRFIAAEAKELRAGGETIITRLADVLVIQAIRWWIENESDIRVGWLAALKDRQIGCVIALIHRRPEHPWTLSELAAEAAMSRSLLTARFRQIVGQSVMRYLAAWRMHLALRSLKDERVDIGQLAQQVGYESESAFNRAFKRYVGVPPGSMRRSSDA
jgi:AraC-like DNA-binding protein